MAASAGAHILRQGGSAIDAAIAAHLVLCVVEPYNTGLGGDSLLLYWSAPEQRLYALNGSGRAPAALTVERLHAAGFSAMPLVGPWSVTVPGAVHAWADAHTRFGRLPWSELFEPALEYAEQGFPVSEVVAYEWELIVHAGVLQDPVARSWFTVDGAPPRLGQVMRAPALARSLRELAAAGPQWLYRGPVAIAAAEAVAQRGGVLAAEDFAVHASTWVEPLATTYRGYEVVEFPPSTQGIAALLALAILENFDLPRYGEAAVDTHHYRIEAVKLALADRNRYVADPEHAEVPVAALLSKDYAQGRAALLRPDRALALPTAGKLPQRSDTVCVVTADVAGNLVSSLSSLYFPFGSGVPVGDTGVVLQNRAAGFVLEPQHPNCPAPHKRPLHTLVPAMLFAAGRPVLAFAVMGGDHQAQAHVQVVSHMVDFAANIQEALDFPRFHVLERNRVAFEEEFDATVVRSLAERGHAMAHPGEVRIRGGFGGGQGILVEPHTGTYWGGSDRRKDGSACGF